MTDARVILITCPDEPAAERIAEVLIGERLAACANLVPGLTSLFRWQGAVERDPEVLLVVKSTAERFEALTRRVREEHPYDVPEIIALPVTEGDPDYLAWIGEETATGASDA